MKKKQQKGSTSKGKWAMQYEIAQQIMGNTKPITKEDFTANGKIIRERREEVYEKFCKMYSEGVASVTVLSRTLKVSNATIQVRKENFNKHLRLLSSNRLRSVDRELAITNMESCIMKLLVEAQKLEGKDKVLAIKAIIDANMQKMKIMWLLDDYSDLYLWKISGTDDIPQNEISKIRELAKAFKTVLDGVEGDGGKQWDKPAGSKWRSKWGGTNTGPEANAQD